MRITSREKDFTFSYIHSLMMLLLQHIITATANATTENSYACRNSSCGALQIRFPFRLKDLQPIHCGYPGFELSCTKNNKTEVELPFSGKFFVKDINYTFQNMEIYDQNDCIPGRLMNFNLSSNSPFKRRDEFENYSYINCSMDEEYVYPSEVIRCLSSPNLTYTVIGERSNSHFSYGLPDNCVVLPLSIQLPKDYFFETKPNSLFMKWDEPKCGRCETHGRKCRYKNHNSSLSAVECFKAPPPYHKPKGKKIAISVSVGIFVFILSGLILIIRIRKKADMKEKENQSRIEQFLENNALKPTRYSHAELKKITNKFETKLGQGGYGGVFEGKLKNGIQVAVKVLDNLEGSNDGEEFVNEVATIGRIHHLNVVRLLGFCVEGSMRALIYEFMMNSSLDKFIFSVEKDKTLINLGWPKLKEIAIGIARGMEYLHQGCDQRILHFDIKPQNILLDHNFTPKISDFGLAKLCTKDTFVTVSMAAARGTIGYIAPEVFSRNFGAISYKSDVYSFGMLLLEMVGGKKNTEIKMEARNDEEYFPEWVHNRLNRGEELGIQAEAEDLDIVKKLLMVALWCIQWNPVDRPSMNSVLHMLEENAENLLMAPNPFASTTSVSSTSRVNHANEVELTPILEDYE
ncbi:hypothetical protein MKW98_029241 [Papaver atlanticum]|uniref:Protein kinase domain-containing protein n=1 Tax=Papaver atlanticum TaxID=357466 RepID=A0AAD4XP79_9MAGN|nr:hypothetical protein MKW98_029241 [Papaver atlanticum]